MLEVEPTGQREQPEVAQDGLDLENLYVVTISTTKTDCNYTLPIICHNRLRRLITGKDRTQLFF